MCVISCNQSPADISLLLVCLRCRDPRPDLGRGGSADISPPLTVYPCQSSTTGRACLGHFCPITGDPCLSASANMEQRRRPRQANRLYSLINHVVLCWWPLRCVCVTDGKSYSRIRKRLGLLLQSLSHSGSNNLESAWESVKHRHKVFLHTDPGSVLLLCEALWIRCLWICNIERHLKKNCILQHIPTW